jgi:hypothetical protein
MTVSHSTGPEFPDVDVRMFPALRVMERQTPPLKANRPPYWRPPIVHEASDNVYVPTWNWVSPHDFPDGEAVTVLDVNAAYLSAMGSVQIAHSHLTNRGPLAHLPAPREVVPGYYRITVPHWAFSGTIVHPLGDSARVQTEDTLWVAAPTLVLLLELEHEGHLGYFEIIDAWTAAVVTEFRSWAERLRSIRTECMDRIDMSQTEVHRAREVARYDAFKQGYSAALSMMLTGEKCLTRRPDWAHTIYAQHAASTWRKAWRWTFTGRSLVAMGAVDEIAVLSKDIGDVIARPKPPFRYDPTGRQLGALKPKKATFVGAESVQHAEAVALIEAGDDIL